MGAKGNEEKLKERPSPRRVECATDEQQQLGHVVPALVSIATVDSRGWSDLHLAREHRCWICN